jgi:hypothetical protein
MPLIGLARKPNIENQNLVLVPRGELHRSFAAKEPFLQEVYPFLID